MYPNIISQILDDEAVLCEAEGRKMCIIPLHHLQAIKDDEQKVLHV